MIRKPKKEWLAGWIRDNMPTRETFERVRWLRPVAHRILRSELWRFHRRSVPRGVALGILVGVLIPVAQTVFAALLALPLRANVPVAALTTFITNPLTTPPLWAFAYWVGTHFVGGSSGNAARPEHQGWVEWIAHDVGPALALGLVIVSLVGAIVGYVVASVGWRLWVGRRWRRRATLPRTTLPGKEGA